MHIKSCYNGAYSVYDVYYLVFFQENYGGKETKQILSDLVSWKSYTYLALFAYGRSIIHWSIIQWQKTRLINGLP